MAKITKTSIPALRKKFRLQADRDNRTFFKDSPVKSVYIDNPVFCASPDFCVIGSEPSFAGMGEKKFRRAAESGRLNFLFQEGDFILLYCLWKYLCREQFAFSITDLAKGAIGTASLKTIRRKERYAQWRPLLEEELALFKPKAIIALGATVCNELANLYRPFYYIPHFSAQNRLLNPPPGKKPTAKLKELRDFSEKALKAAYKNQPHGEEHIGKTLEKLFTKALNRRNQTLLRAYSDIFTRIGNREGLM